MEWRWEVPTTGGSAYGKAEEEGGCRRASSSASAAPAGILRPGRPPQTALTVTGIMSDSLGGKGPRTEISGCSGCSGAKAGKSEERGCGLKWKNRIQVEEAVL